MVPILLIIIAFIIVIYSTILFVYTYNCFFVATLDQAQSKLSKATTNSDLSTTEDEEKKTFNSSGGLVDTLFPPPKYKDYCSKVTKSKHDVESIFNVDNHESLSDNNDDNIADDNDDSDCDGRIIINKSSNDSISEENILIQSSSNAVFSPNTQVWKVNHLNRYGQTEISPNFQFT
ncbi:unnamed protein product [Macrosiphum euphorbiae]|uniref:ATP synthase F0 subunit 8 n=1 Tax=Macrosiphum euphorbiae TaxID=13131 RepID=A0AAV0WLF6_9HEMI|nr:unnamed protein product [Macrosiphum euphorbiae]